MDVKTFFEYILVENTLKNCDFDPQRSFCGLEKEKRIGYGGRCRPARD